MTGVTLLFEDIAMPGGPMPTNFGKLPIAGAMSISGGSGAVMGGMSLEIDQDYANGIADFSIADARNRHDLKFLDAGTLLLVDEGQILILKDKPTLNIGPKGARSGRR
jgi:hypothetical protein